MQREGYVHHKLKIEECYHRNIQNKSKKAEIRFNDRDYQVGDTMSFDVNYNDDRDNIKAMDKNGVEIRQEWEITHILSGFGLQNGYVMLSIEEVI